jgi:hypothetical protein
MLQAKHFKQGFAFQKRCCCCDVKRRLNMAGAGRETRLVDLRRWIGRGGGDLFSLWGKSPEVTAAAYSVIKRLYNRLSAVRHKHNLPTF